MDGGQQAHVGAVTLTPAALGRLMPMYLTVGDDGMITSAGETLQKLFTGVTLVGTSLFALFMLRRVGAITTIEGLRTRLGQPLSLQRRDGGAGLRGQAVPLAHGQGLLLNLSFGIGVVDAVRAIALTDADFAPTDLAIELLYVVEAKSLVMNELARLNAGLKGAKTAAEARARTDMLTGLGNRRALDDAIAKIMLLRQPFAIMNLDLDFFKSVNDTLGHAAGDFVLVSAADVLRAATRDGDIVVRVGGDEFMLLFPNPPDHQILLRIAQRIIQGLEVPIPFEDQECRISGSIGIALPQHFDGVDVASMIAVADAALYASKRAGRGRATLAEMPGAMLPDGPA